MNKIPYYRFSVAPMLKRTDKYCRYFYRKLTRHSLLYTEMIHSNAIINNKVLLLNNYGNNIALQLAGNDYKILSLCSKQAEKLGYKEVNLNVGCPSIKSQKGNFGACLMKQYNVLSDCIKSMSDSVSIPITIKTRIGINDDDSYAFLCNFIEILSNSGCNMFIIHARKAFLFNKSKIKMNLKASNLNYKVVYRIKKTFPNIKMSINGGIQHLKEVKNHLKHVDGVMMGRKIFNDPKFLMKIDEEIFCQRYISSTPLTIIKSMYSYIEEELKKGIHFKKIISSVLNIFNGTNGSANFKKFINNKNNYLNNNSIQVLDKALSYIKNI
ncbi:tRNA dihydrouridine(20/20a) synthase DusA [Enterobacteriaceae endosymbiont of Plateumaris consimilis]|uniref:tRNA dihydrouridine(20/20a) synthase DusA n=1 Tax=Enterobacteriaceae endosymbiont of Plateumaris consimilis TaxID=2675794 RepID=UPI001449A105|nr:tRNA dihydrouridine(20/20a) synthase DusA [Enterobacteriaceae endosymbiont of Plateumaris consimilis]QJC28460.1 tRNA dihydrouridine(20/20a) synthase DusA [Enterobacteriaceae endosymbiont of Plateumaris consimilis]